MSQRVAGVSLVDGLGPLAVPLSDDTFSEMSSRHSSRASTPVPDSDEVSDESSVSRSSLRKRAVTLVAPLQGDGRAVSVVSPEERARMARARNREETRRLVAGRADEESGPGHAAAAEKARSVASGGFLGGITRMFSRDRAGTYSASLAASQKKTADKVDGLRKRYFAIEVKYLRARDFYERSRLQDLLDGSMKEYIDTVMLDLDDRFGGEENRAEKQQALFDELSKIAKERKFSCPIGGLPWYSESPRTLLSQSMILGILIYIAFTKERPDCINLELYANRESPLIPSDSIESFNADVVKASEDVERIALEQIDAAVEDIAAFVKENKPEEVDILLNQLGEKISRANPASQFAGNSSLVVCTIKERVAEREGTAVTKNINDLLDLLDCHKPVLIGLKETPVAVDLEKQEECIGAQIALNKEREVLDRSIKEVEDEIAAREKFTIKVPPLPAGSSKAQVADAASIRDRQEAEKAARLEGLRNRVMGLTQEKEKCTQKIKLLEDRDLATKKMIVWNFLYPAIVESVTVQRETDAQKRLEAKSKEVAFDALQEEPRVQSKVKCYATLVATAAFLLGAVGMFLRFKSDAESMSSGAYPNCSLRSKR